MKRETIILSRKHVRPFFDKKWSGDADQEKSMYLTKEVNLSKNSILLKFISLINLNDFILDLGCGDGRIALFLARKRFKNIDAYDFSKEAINRLNSIKEKKRYKINTKIKDLNKITLKEKEYNAIICTSALHYFSNAQIEKIFEKIHKALQDKGIIYLTFESGLELKLESGMTFNFSSQSAKKIEDYTALIKKKFQSLGYKIEFSKIHSKKLSPTLPFFIAKKLKTNDKRYIRKMVLYEVILRKP